MKKKLLLIQLSLLLSISLVVNANIAAAKTTGGDLIYATDSAGSDNFSFLGCLPPAWVQLTNDRIIRYNYNDEKEGFYPMLAKRYVFSPDYKTLDIYLRKGIKWQGGYGELTAADVKYTFDLQSNADKGSWQAWWWAAPDKGGFIKSTEVVSRYHFRFNFSRPPYPAWLSDLSTPFMGIACKKYVEKVGLEKAIMDPIGTGPWQLIKHVPGSYMKFERNDDYWGKKPDFKYLTIRFVPEINTQIAMLRAGAVDIIGIPPDKISQIKAAGLRTFSIPEATGTYIMFGGQLLSTDPTYDPTVPWVTHTNEPADSAWNQRALKVRKALNLAINRKAIYDKIMHGACIPMTTYVWPPDMLGYKSEWKKIPYDPDQAKKLLSEAGYPNGFKKPITMYIDTGNTYAGATGKDMALAVANDLEAIGLKVNRQIIDATAFNNLWYAGRKDAWCMSAMYLEVYPEPTMMWPWLLSSKTETHGAFMSPEFDKIINKVNDAITMSEKGRIKLEQSGEDWIYNNYMFAPIAFENKIAAFGPKIKGISRYEKYAQYSEPGLTFRYITRSK
jgi:ABC-type transport system substrate-binding protein